MLASAGFRPQQWQKAQAHNLARTGVQSAKIKNSSVASAPKDTVINRTTSPVTTSGSLSTDARKAGQRAGGFGYWRNPC